VAVLRQRKADQAAEQLHAGDSWRGARDGYVFTTRWGEPVYPDTVTSLMTKLIRANQLLPHARLHDLRHLHATTLLLSGVPVHVVAARLGRADPGITLRVYAHVIRSAEAAAADIFARPSRGHGTQRHGNRAVSKPVSKKAPSKIGKGSELGAAYRNRTDDYALRGARSRASHTLAAPIARAIALIALAAPGLFGDPVHEPVHVRGRASPHPATVRRRC
jgi:hypothetical protein